MATSMLVNPWSMNSTDFRYDQRHYKKDSRFVMDLYTLTYDSHESLDCHGVMNNNVSLSLSNRYTREVIKIRVRTVCLSYSLSLYGTLSLLVDGLDALLIT